MHKRTISKGNWFPSSIDYFYSIFWVLSREGFVRKVFHILQRVRGLGGQGAELGILRRWDLRGQGGKMRPAGCHGKKVLKSGQICARPRLPALTTLAPEPRHGGLHRTKPTRCGPGKRILDGTVHFIYSFMCMGIEKKILFMVHVMKAPAQDFFMSACLMAA